MISFILAMDEERGIGVDNQLPWHLPADLAFFKKVTSGHTILMGRKTYESIGRPLPKRRNVIMTRDPKFAAEGCEVVHSVEEALQVCGGREAEGELFVIGGADIFRSWMPVADKMYVTHIAHRFAADTFFGDIDMAEWTVVSREKGPKDEKNPYDYEFVVYERRR
ncbi:MULTISPECIES: dihydrofolate reductase [Paenibacillus]|uniref:dihydrofolate reductase n=1 Tax=Paenibacillus TaxID=44249 RepID=UPI0024C184A6|nr:MULTISPECIES: dihydrofolate reductase [Paenibacillus]